MIITVTIAAWAQAIATTAAPTAGTSRTTSTKRVHEPGWGPDSPPVTRPARCWATSSGSGRSRTHTQTAATTSTTEPIAKPPVSSGMPRDRATAPPTPRRFGPATAPIVVAHTTTDSARARCSSVARSVAA